MEKKSNIKSKIRGAYLTSLISISLVLLLLGIVGLLILNAQVLSQYVKENLCFSLIIKNDVKEPDIKQYQKNLDTYKYIKSTEYITKEDAALSLQDELGEDFLETLGYNPLSPTINVYLNSDYANPDSITMLETFFLTDTNLVSEVSYQQNLVHLINDNVRKISVIFLFFSIALFLISFALLNNTIRLMIYSKRFIINTMKLVGAKRNFIRKPFLITGALQGFFSALIAIAVLSVIVYFMDNQIGNMLSLIDYKTLGLLFAIVMLLGILLTFVSTYFSINKYLRLKSANLYY
ncbi:MAG: permease-like cell division protein FtsX [Bacteroidales bacterium]|nr:permease-like cell division protein FtsX [Bacteroidales bacterium]MDD4217032.1 permease-like cell division protein FtsX [Bacteroidales bacterium]MDY0142303.1 permease-like cell division protein FtsX [Bacteroidales bacterium]